jgi:hypothetical protein
MSDDETAEALQKRIEARKVKQALALKDIEIEELRLEIARLKGAAILDPQHPVPEGN